MTLFVTLNAVKGLTKDSSLRSEWQVGVWNDTVCHPERSEGSY